MVLYLFVVAYVGGGADPISRAGSPSLRVASALFAGALFVELSIAVLGTGLTALGEEGAGFFEGFGTPSEIGRLLLTDFLLAFEVASILLLIAAVGAVILARRRTGLEDPREISVGDLMRSGSRDQLTGGEAGTMIEVEGPRGR
jgi:NADH-quinone oxidoreductase subunit J